jgi:phage FluMu protein Com
VTSAGEEPAARVVVVHSRTKKHKVAEWLQEHAARHRMRCEEGVSNRGKRVWNIDCDACGTKLSKVGGMVDLEKHLKSAKHVNAMSAGEDPATRVVLHARPTHKVAEWLQEHATEHRMRSEEGVGKRGMRVWNIDCDACDAKLWRVRSMRNLEDHVKSAKHVNAMSAGEDPATRVVLRPRTRKNKLAEWLQEHAAGHRMRCEEGVNKRGDRVWNIHCDACGTKLSMVSGVARLELHLQSAKHVNAMSATEGPASRSTPAVAARKRPRS